MREVVIKHTLIPASIFLCMGCVPAASAQMTEDTAEGECPCFTYQEVRAIFDTGARLSEDAGEISCSASHYTVEFSADVSVWNNLYELVAQAGMEWFDFDRSHCQFIDNTAEPSIERLVTWEEPSADLAVPAKTCFGIIARAIADWDQSGVCFTFP